MIFTKKQGRSSNSIRAVKYKKYVAGKNTHARAPLAWKYTNGIFDSTDGTTGMKIVS